MEYGQPSDSWCWNNSNLAAWSERDQYEGKQSLEENYLEARKVMGEGFAILGKVDIVIL